MSYRTRVVCDSPHCDEHREIEDTGELPVVPPEWLVLQRPSHYSLHFCSLTCLQNWAKPEHNPYVSKQFRKEGAPL